ncbi:DUF6150 family protein [Hymenobacter sp. AT01-02]|uniref:DUF6150 family protein n=1 Tax=Hymenobacter sp. AT01-02 TaxID=1571877 RepID=UPI000ABCA7BF|nr:DUF6150 family protein [Hymenobacter sp. AT01-02]
MLASVLFSGLLALSPFQPAPRVPFVAATQPVSVEPCRIYGSVYLETDPRRKNYCFGTLYIEAEDTFADVLVYKETNKLFADKAGLWYITDSPSFADYSLFVTPQRNLADFAIYFTKVRSFAGCRQQ